MQYNIIEVKTWLEFKNIALNIKVIPIQYKEEDNYYEIYASEKMIWHIRLLKGTAEAIDFENNYKSDANKRVIDLVYVVDNNNNNLIGELQDTPAQYTLLKRLKDLWDKLNDLFTNGTGKFKLWDGTNVAEIDSNNHLYVGGKTDIGETPLTKPIYTAGRDVNGYLRALLTDDSGVLKVSVVPVIGTMISISVESIYSAFNKYQWQEVAEYEIPENYYLSISCFDALSTIANEKARVIRKGIVGSFECSTDTFTDEVSIISPDFFTKINIYVTTELGSSSDDNITITYTNHLGVSGRTATITIPKGTIVGSRLEVNLQAGDIGLLDVTNVTHSDTGQAGAFNIEGLNELFYLVMTSSNILYNRTSGVGGIEIKEGDKIFLQYKSESTSAVLRRISLNGTLISKGII